MILTEFLQPFTGLIFISIGFSITLFLLEILKQKKNKSSIFLILFSLNLSFLQYRLFLFSEGNSHQYPLSLIFLVGSIFLIGPLIFAISRNILDFAFLENQPELKPHLLIPCIVPFFEIIFQIQNFNFKSEYINTAYREWRFDFLQISILLAVLHLNSYIIFYIYKFITLKKNFEINYSFPILLVLCFGLLITIFLFLGFITKETWILKLGIFSVGIISILLLYYRETYPMLFETLKMEVETKRYEKTQLNGINVEAIKERITELMEVTRIYKNDEIRLSDLADELLINQNQLSRILNETYKKNFNEFINNFRINEAKVLLIKQKDKTILSIAFEVGFNTKATFNSWFIKFTGMTPTEFRKKNV